ncbi:yippee zinc-binding/DNA-binding /Mis18, centromere assembly-domain-containing protein [Xylariales sp. AK1849]|nr:yippee zinc-binding/DNA-binding /Mis18, centromere assembly-domain-containing protein [Xylariales sp. AK1849]
MPNMDTGKIFYEQSGSPPKFPIYLLPSFTIPFRRRSQSSTSYGTYGSPPNENHIPSLSASPTDSTLSSPAGSPLLPSFLPSGFSISRDSRRSSVAPLNVAKLTRTQPDTLRCSTCSTDLAFTSQIVSKGFTGRYGRAYLVSPPEDSIMTRDASNLINIKVGRSETRALVTGSHIVADITCVICHTKVGWKYVDAKEESQKYKVGKFILETMRVSDHQTWEDVLVSEMPELEMESKQVPPAAGNEPIIFDSEDEDECEDIFSGTWDATIVAKRRSRKVNQRRRQAA